MTRRGRRSSKVERVELDKFVGFVLYSNLSDAFYIHQAVAKRQVNQWGAMPDAFAGPWAAIRETASGGRGREGVAGRNGGHA